MSHIFGEKMLYERTHSVCIGVDEGIFV